LQTYHRLIEAFKHAFAKRSYLGDSSFVNVIELTKNLTSENYINEIYKLIDDTQTFNTSYYGPSWSGKSDSGTAHISVLDQYGNAVALTATVNTL
jgi:gamma-glutamyltranspeptidase / glutathione hydrolase / leukotriene-C4 hydrolase